MRTTTIRGVPGLWGTPTYRSWYSMIDRCGSPKNASWPFYGGRGVMVCDRWFDLKLFIADMGLRPDGTSIDRIRSSGNYEPGNCRWATELEQQLNRRNVKCSIDMARLIREMVMAGASQKEAAQAFGLSPSNVSLIVSRRTWK